MGMKIYIVNSAFRYCIAVGPDSSMLEVRAKLHDCFFRTCLNCSDYKLKWGDNDITSLSKTLDDLDIKDKDELKLELTIV